MWVGMCVGMCVDMFWRTLRIHRRQSRGRRRHSWPRSWVPPKNKSWMPLENRSWMPLENRSWTPPKNKSQASPRERSRLLSRSSFPPLLFLLFKLRLCPLSCAWPQDKNLANICCKRLTLTTYFCNIRYYILFFTLLHTFVTYFTTYFFYFTAYFCNILYYILL